MNYVKLIICFVAGILNAILKALSAKWIDKADVKNKYAIYITRDYIVRQTENLVFIVIHHDE